MKTPIARREFLRRAGLSFGFVGLGSTIFESLVAHFFRQAMAETVNKGLNPSGYYVHFTFPGAPPRWLFDLPLTPTGKTEKNFVAGNFGTRIEKSGAEFRPVYEVEKHVIGGKTLYLPPVWKMSASGNKFTDILPHTLFVRGLDMEINSHQLSNARQTAPVIGGISLNGAVADLANRPMPCIVDPGPYAAQAFRSQKGFSASPIGTAVKNPVDDLLSPFKKYMEGRPVHSAAAAKLSEQAFAEFEKYAQDRGLASHTLTEAYDSAMDLIESNIADLSKQWEPTLKKYAKLIEDALLPKKGSLPGIFDQKIPTKNVGEFKYARQTDGFLKLGDMRDMFNEKTTIPRMAENFALAEILLDKTTASMVLGFPAINQLESGSGRFTATHDQHDSGSLMSTMMTTLYFRSFLNCMTEFVDALKAKNIFDRTVLHVSAEFNRTPRTDGSGSDHGFMAGNTTLISGMIKDPAIIGNIQTQTYSGVYKGTFGVAKPYVLDGFNRPIQVNDVALTISAMLGVDNIVTNGRSLLEPVGGIWKPRKEEAKNV